VAGRDKWPPGVRREGYIVVDGPSLSSLLDDNETLPHVVFVDTTDPADLPYEGGAPFLGWVRAPVVDLQYLAEDLERSPYVEDRTYKIHPHRDHPDQIPMYTITGGRLLEPHGGGGSGSGHDERYKFPKGTPRGWQGCVAMWESIPTEYRGRQKLGPPPAWFVKQQEEEKEQRQKEEAI
jgi:hypothetical protein